MKRIVQGQHVADWIAARVGKSAHGPLHAIGIEIDGELAGGILFNSYTGDDVEMTIAGEPRAWTPIFVRYLAHYAWHTLGVERVSMTTESDEVASLAMRMGARVEGCKRNAFGPGRHGYLFGILKDEWRFKS